MTERDGGTEGRSQQLGRWYAEWEAKHEGSTPFRPEENADVDDYNLYSVVLEADPEAFAELMTGGRRIMGLDPDTGLPIESAPAASTEGEQRLDRGAGED